MENLFQELETDRLILRKISLEDASDLYKNVFNNFSYYKYYYQLPFKDFFEYKELVSKYEEWYNNGNHFRWGIVLKESNEMIGTIQLHTKDMLNNNCKVGYIIGYNFQNKGYMKEVLQSVISFAFNIVKFHRIQAEIVVENNNSIKLVENLGMEEEGIKKESYLLQNTYYDQKIYRLINKNEK